ncbi:MAG: deoxyribonuclease V [Cytophagales bacterium]|nr:deoxyribonuclease V [Armatimonadota bacterium]
MHDWNLTPEAAVALQRQLAAQVRTTNGFDPEAIRFVAGIDASYRQPKQGETGDGTSYAVVVVLRFPDLELVDQATATEPTVFPYVPGLLSFRETPPVLKALAKLAIKPDLLMLDGQGIAHPRRFGIACHVGLLTDTPALGVAKSVLTGRYENLGDAPGDTAPLLYRGETIGMALRSKARTNALILSAGHKIDLPTTVRMVLACLRGYRLPETTRQADKISKIIENPADSNRDTAAETSPG